MVALMMGSWLGLVVLKGPQLLQSQPMDLDNRTWLNRCNRIENIKTTRLLFVIHFTPLVSQIDDLDWFLSYHFGRERVKGIDMEFINDGDDNYTVLLTHC